MSTIWMLMILLPLLLLISILLNYSQNAFTWLRLNGYKWGSEQIEIIHGWWCEIWHDRVEPWNQLKELQFFSTCYTKLMVFNKVKTTSVRSGDANQMFWCGKFLSFRFGEFKSIIIKWSTIELTVICRLCFRSFFYCFEPRHPFNDFSHFFGDFCDFFP